VKDLTSIEDREARIRAEKICLTAGKTFILNRAAIKTGADFINVIQTAELTSVKGA
jgi:5-methylthioribose kinase